MTTPIETFFAQMLAQVFGLDTSILVLIGMGLFSTFVFILRPPFSVAISAVGLFAVVLFGSLIGTSIGLGYSAFVFGAIIFMFAITLYFAWRRFVAGDY